MKPIRCDGTTRRVYLVGNLAFKFPQTGYESRHFLLGMIANLEEAMWWERIRHKSLCPVLLKFPLGLLIIMRRARPLTPAEFESFDYSEWCKAGDTTLPAENKQDSFGFLNGRIVAVDYGN